MEKGGERHRGARPHMNTTRPKERTMRTAARQLCFQLAAVMALAAVSLAQTPLIEQGRAAMGRGEDDTAIELFEKAVAQSPKSAEAHYGLASAYGSKAQKSGMM